MVKHSLSHRAANHGAVFARHAQGGICGMHMRNVHYSLFYWNEMFRLFDKFLRIMVRIRISDRVELGLGY